MASNDGTMVSLSEAPIQQSILRDSSVIMLPSQRTLRDYTHCLKACSGFTEVDEHLSTAMQLTTCEEHEKLVVLLLDEMHVRENLVFNKHEGSLVGLVNLGEVNTHLLAFQNQLLKRKPDEGLARTMMVFMVCRLFTNLQYLYFQLVQTLTRDLLFDPF